MALVEVWRDDFTYTRQSVLSVLARNTNGTDLYYAPLSTGAEPDGTRGGHVAGVYWHDNHHRKTGPDADGNRINDLTGLPICGVGSINLAAVAFHPSRVSPGLINHTVSTQDKAPFIPVAKGLPTNELADWDLRGGEFRCRMALDNAVFAPGARLVFWFQTWDSMAGPNREGMNVNYFQSADPICRQLGVPEPAYRGGNTITVTRDWTDIVVPLPPIEHFWTAMEGNAEKNNTIYGRSDHVELALRRWNTDFGVIFFNGPDSPPPDKRNRGTMKFDHMSLWLPED